MLVGARTGAWSGGAKPPYDAEVEYINSVGNSYFVTDVYPTNKTKVTAEFEYVAYSYSAIFGSSRSGVNRFWLGMQASSVRLVWFFADGTSNPNIGTVVGKRLNVAFNDEGRLIVNGTPYTLTKTEGFKSGSRMIIFRDPGNASNFAHGKLFGMTVYEDGEKIAEYIPVRATVDGVSVGTLYDNVRKKLMDVIGDAFEIGPDK